MSLSDIVLGRPKRRKPAPPPAQARRAPPQPAPTEPTAPRRPRATEAPAQPTKAVEPKTLRALIVDPVARTIAETRLAMVEPGNAGRAFGQQIAMGPVEKIVGGGSIEWIDITDADTALVDHSRQGETAEAEAWRFGEDGELVAGPAVIVGYDAAADSYADAALALDEARRLVIFEDAEAGEDDRNIRKEIEARLEGLDEAQKELVLRRAMARPEVIDAIDTEAFAIKNGRK